MAPNRLGRKVMAPEPPELDYRQLADILRQRISAGEWRGDPLPPVSQLRQEYNVDRQTVIRATELLKREGLLLRSRTGAST